MQVPCSICCQRWCVAGAALMIPREVLLAYEARRQPALPSCLHCSQIVAQIAANGHHSERWKAKISTWNYDSCIIAFTENTSHLQHSIGIGAGTNTNQIPNTETKLWELVSFWKTTQIETFVIPAQSIKAATTANCSFLCMCQAFHPQWPMAKIAAQKSPAPRNSWERRSAATRTNNAAWHTVQ